MDLDHEGLDPFIVLWESPRDYRGIFIWVNSCQPSLIELIQTRSYPLYPGKIKFFPWTNLMGKKSLIPVYQENPKEMDSPKISRGMKTVFCNQSSRSISETEGNLESIVPKISVKWSLAMTESGLNKAREGATAVVRDRAWSWEKQENH